MNTDKDTISPPTTEDVPDLANPIFTKFLLRQETHDVLNCAFEVLYKQQPVGLYIPDLIAFSAVIVDTKVIERITDHERGQMLNYPRITKLRVGLILNFRFPRLQFERVVL